jgi:hypothetical protein
MDTATQQAARRQNTGGVFGLGAGRESPHPTSILTLAPAEILGRALHPFDKSQWLLRLAAVVLSLVPTLFLAEAGYVRC